MSKQRKAAAPAETKGEVIRRVPDEVRKDAVVRARVTGEQAQAFEDLGGPDWLRRELDKAIQAAKTEG